jgi:hypothetical protein
MSLNTLLYLRTNGKAKKSLYSLFISLVIPCPFQMVFQNKEASHAL